MMKESDMNGAPQSEHLEELIRVQKKMLLHTRIATAFNMVLCLVLLGIIIASTRWLSVKAEQVETTLTAVDQMVEDAGVLIESTNTLVTDNADTVAETVQKLNEVDIETLNDAISNLNTAIEPLSNFASLFQR
jgi:glycerol-3-phosphate O-acyltransferase